MIRATTLISLNDARAINCGIKCFRSSFVLGFINSSLTYTIIGQIFEGLNMSQDT